MSRAVVAGLAFVVFVAPGLAHAEGGKGFVVTRMDDHIEIVVPGGGSPIAT